MASPEREAEIAGSMAAAEAFIRRGGTARPVEALTPVPRVARHRHRAMVVATWLAAPAASAVMTAMLLALVNALGVS